jgi:PAS domain S-box-containing protein
METDSHRRSIKKQIDMAAQQADEHVFNRIGNLSRRLSANVYIKMALDGRKSVELPAVLNAVRDSFSADVIYLMNRKGTVIASSGYGKSSFLGNEYPFRRYFKESLSGKDSIYAALGVTTGKKGIYFTSPVTGGMGITGVVAVKIGTVDLDEVFKRFGQIAVLVSPEGVVFSSSHPEFLYKSIGIIPAPVLKRLNDEQQFGGRNIEPLNWKIAGETIRYANEMYYFDSRPVKMSGWKIIMAEKTSGVSALTGIQKAVFMGSSAVIMLLFSVILLLIVNIRKRKIAEMNTVESEKHLRNILESTGEGFWQVDAAGITLEVNPAMCAMIGASREEIVGQPSLKYLDGSWTKGLKVSFGSKFQKQSGPVEGLIFRKDGTALECLLKSTLLTDEKGSITGAFAMVGDMTEIKNTEKALRQSERNYREIFDSVNDAVFIHDLNNFKIIDVNMRMLEMFRCTREQALMIELASLGYDSPTRAFEYMEKASLGEPQIFEWRVGRADGTTFWVEVSLKKAMINGTERLLAVVRDIEERKKVQEVIRYRMEFEDLVAQISTDFINIPLQDIDSGIERALMDVAMFADATGGTVFVFSDDKKTISNTHEWHEEDEYYSKLYFQNIDIENMPYLWEKIKNKEPLIVGNQDELPADASGEMKMIGGIEFRPFIYMPMVKEGELYGILGFYGERLREKMWDDEFVMLLHIVIDIVLNALERKRSEEKLGQTMAELKRSNEELEQFAYVASHDLKEPLRMVSSYVKLLEKRYRGRLGSDADDFIGFAVEGADRMQKLINDLLAFSRVGRLGGEEEIFEVNGLLDEVVNSLKIKIDEYDAVVEYNIDMPAITGDRVQIGQLFQNLISNALKFHSAEKPRIIIKGETKGEFHIFSVRDNGIGIKQDYFEKIFVIFQQLHSKDKYSGTGMGLAICKKIVERHGGRIWVESAEGSGSTFYFTIPEKK